MTSSTLALLLLGCIQEVCVSVDIILINYTGIQEKLKYIFYITYPKGKHILKNWNPKIFRVVRKENVYQPFDPSNVLNSKSNTIFFCNTQNCFRFYKKYIGRHSELV